MIKAVIFDLDDTLYDCNYKNNNESVLAVCRFTAEKLLYLPFETVKEAFDRARLSIKKEMGSDIAAIHNRMLYFQRTLELLGEKPVSHCLEMYNYFWEDFLSRISLFEDAKKFLELLRDKNIKIGICTDMTVHIQHRKLRALGISDYIDALVTSEEAGIEKPSEKIYRLCLKKLKVQPEECVFIGDSLKKDVLGPKKIGMEAILFLEKGMVEASTKKTDDNIILAKSYKELIDLF